MEVFEVNEAIAAMLKNYGQIREPDDEKNAIKEIIQYITLLGLHRGGFFEKASFYGGTALRLLYGLDRFSEDMDFCLNKQDSEFNLKPYFSPILEELERFGFNAKIESKKTGPEAVIESAFVKQDTIEGLLLIEKNLRGAIKGELLKVRLEVDKYNPEGASFSKKLVKLPVPYMIGTLTEPSLFAGKIHALIARTYLNRVKGRDYYDFLFYMARGTKVNIKYLESKLRDSKHFSDDDKLSLEALKEILVNKFKTVDFSKAKADVLPFIKKDKVSSLNDWSYELFSSIAQELAVE